MNYINRLFYKFWRYLFHIVFKRISIGSLSLHCVDGTRVVFGESNEIIDIQVKDINFYKKVLLGGSMGLGEAYVLGMWTTPNLNKCLTILAANCQGFGIFQKGLSIFKRIIDKKNSLKNIKEHYDLSNEFYATFLDESMTYSSALFLGNICTLEEAQINKINRIINLAQIEEGDSVLEIGSGWGSLARKVHAKCKSIKTITLSAEQYKYVCKLVDDKGLSDKIKVKLQDYREENGKYDKVISCEMIEAVGKEYLVSYFKKIRDSLKKGGLAVIQAITIRDEDYNDYSRSCDWIQKYIFPGGHLPSMSLIKNHVNEIDDLEICHTDYFGDDYSKTLELWKIKFEKSKNTILSLGFDEYFFRKWQYYFSYCKAGFDNGLINVGHIIIKRI